MTQVLQDPEIDDEHAHLRAAETGGNPEQADYDRKFGDILGHYHDADDVPDNLSGGGNADSPESLEGAETAAGQASGPSQPRDYGPSLGDELNDRLGRGYSSDDPKSKRRAKSFDNKSTFKKKVAIAGAAAGGSVLLGVIVFLALLPLKIEHIMANIDSHFGASASSALDTENMNFFNQYMVKDVLPNLGKGKCHSTIDASCIVSTSNSKTLPGQLFNAWKQSRLEQKLAEKGLVFGKQGGQYYLSVQGSKYDIGAGKSIFDAKGVSAATAEEMRQGVRDMVKNGTLYDKAWLRFKAYRLLKDKYDVPYCVTRIGCKFIDAVNDPFRNLRLAAKGYAIQYSVGFVSAEWSVALQCVLGGSNVCDSIVSDQVTKIDAAGDEEKTSQFQRNMKAQLDALQAKIGDEALSKVLSDAGEISDKGLFRFAFEKAMTALGVKIGVQKALSGAVPVFGWINEGAQLVKNITGIGPKLQAISFAIGTMGAVKLYMMNQNVADEVKAGTIDATEAGSFSDQFSDDTQLDGTGSDMTAAPMYAVVNSQGSSPGTASIFSDIFGGMAFAATPVPQEESTHNGTYLCNNGKPVPSGDKICPEEVLNGGSATANAVTNIQKNVPGWDGLAVAANAWSSSLGQLFGAVGGGAGWIIQHLPGVGNAQNFFSKIIQPVETALSNFIMPTPFSTNMSGGRNFDMTSAGAAVTNMDTCQDQLGCARLTPVQAAQIQNEQIAENKAEFDSMPMFARIFDTDSSYSLVSRLAMDMPTNVVGAASEGLASIITNPLTQLANAFSSLFSMGMNSTAFAATTAISAEQGNFGVPYTGYTAIPKDPSTFWDQNCVSGPLATYDSASKQLDVSDWINKDQEFDPSLGISVATQTNPCLLIQSSMQTLGVTSDPKFAPPNSENSD